MKKYHQPEPEENLFHLFKEYDCRLIVTYYHKDHTQITYKKEEMMSNFWAWKGAIIYDHPYISISKVNKW